MNLLFTLFAMNTSYKYIFQHILIACCLFLTGTAFAQNTISLAGQWRFQLDPNREGISNNWQNKKLPQQINLPGTTDEAQYGDKTSGSDFGILTRAYKYYGPAWYQCDITIPSTWKDKRVVLELERVMWESQVYINNQKITTQDALSSAHLHDLGFLPEGKHQLTIRIDNDMIHNIGDKGHVYTEYTQSIWNGAVGRIRLIAQNKVRLTNPQVYTKINPRQISVFDTLINETTKPKTIQVHYQLFDKLDGQMVFSAQENITALVGKTPISYATTLNPSIKLWDDVHPNLYTLKIELKEKGEQFDQQEIEFGFREVSSAKSKMMVNGKPVFLRGNLDCVHFPLTGYPSCKVEDWERIFRIYKDYGLNHVRFHSWCPPEAAFVAANRIGIYIQSEAIWIDWWMTNTPPDRKDMITKGNPEGLGKNPSADAFIQKELARMIRFYGNHPSFALMCIGNELGNSDFDVMESWLKSYKANDSRRLYSVSSARKIMPLDQYMVTHYMNKLGATRGIRAGARTDWDFEDVYAKANIPVIAHEIGQWPVYPRWDEIKKYTGVLKARNFEEFREQARKNKIAEQNADFVMASGALNQLMYKHEIESFLRTPSCAGIQLLSMQDYQGQGEALIGWLDVFYDSKGITTPEKFRQHHDTTVTLLRTPKFVWDNSETFTATIQMAHYGTQAIKDVIYWKVKDQQANVIQQGTLPEQIFAVGSSKEIAPIQVDLRSITKTSQLTVEVGLVSRPIKNTWDIWVYPDSPNNKPMENKIHYTTRFDADCQARLARGESVLLQASELGNDASADPISFYPLYWSLTFFPGQGKNTIGLLVQDKHPIFKNFPTQAHSNWQWQSIYTNARAFYINDYPEWYKPMAQPVDDFHRNNKLASIFELKVGKGKLLVCGFNISDNSLPAARQLKSSILDYMKSTDFDPQYSQDIQTLQKTFVYIEPLKSSIPGEFSKALLYVEAGVQQKMLNSNETWTQAKDMFESKKGTQYKVTADGVWKDSISSAWQGREITLDIQCPRGIIGSLYVFFHDWNNNGRQADLLFEGREYSIAKHDKDGVWVKLHVMREDSNDGQLQLKAKVKRGPNVMISKIALVEE